MGTNTINPEYQNRVWYRASKYILATLFTFTLFLSAFSFANAATYYVSPSGSDTNSGLSTSAPWGTFVYAMTKLQPGDTLYLMDGTYNQTLDVTISGTLGNPITFKALNDGKAIIDGQNIRLPFIIGKLGGNGPVYTDINVEGIVFKEGLPKNGIFTIWDAQRINVRRVTSHGATTNDSESHPFIVNTSSNILIEDCLANNRGFILINVHESDHVTVRRCVGIFGTFNRILGGQQVVGGYGIEIYGSRDSLVENNIMMASSDADKRFIGIWTWRNNYSSDASRNKVYGNVVVAPSSESFIIELLTPTK